MDSVRREYLTARICSGGVRVHVNDTVYVIRRPTREQLCVAQEVYSEQLYQAELDGLFNEQDLYDFLIQEKLWDEESELLLQRLPGEMEEFKLQLFKANFRSQQRKVVRTALYKARVKLAEMEARRHAYDHLSCTGFASTARGRFMVGCSLFTESGQRVFGDEGFWQYAADLLDQVLAVYATCRLSESDYRDLARNEPWRSLWGCRKAEGSLFGVPAVDYTEEQRSLVAFSTLYDSISEHPECPGDDVIEDDDMLDGWLIDQRRRREAEQTKKAGEELLGNEKIRGAQEVYLVADTVEDARKVVNMNDEHARSLQKQRFAYLKEKGEVNELDMPDTKRRLRMEVTQKLSEAVKGK